MVTHKQIWNAIDNLAEKNDLTASGLARAAGLDATAFNKSKRVGPNGKHRWPSTESIAKILAATGSTFDIFAGMAMPKGGRGGGGGGRMIPLIGMAQAGNRGFFDDSGFPAGSGWDEIASPGVSDEHAYALKIKGDSMTPAYRDGTVIIVSPDSEVRKGDRVVVKTVKGEVMAKEVGKKSSKSIELKSLNPSYPARTLDMSDVAFVSRIVWASQ
jgi:phage repressor protein C with HTH and peptisase S24 domain